MSDTIEAVPQSEAEKKAEALRQKEERAADAAAAMREFEAEKTKLLDNTLRLRALRLAREAEAQQVKGGKVRKASSGKVSAAGKVPSAGSVKVSKAG